MGCRQARPAELLVRVARGPDGVLAVGYAIPGRGAWICARSSCCVRLARRKGAWSKALRASVAETEVAQIEAILETIRPPQSDLGRSVCEDGWPGVARVEARVAERPRDARTCE